VSGNVRKYMYIVRVTRVLTSVNFSSGPPPDLLARLIADSFWFQHNEEKRLCRAVIELACIEEGLY
jgi:hypothetical protein